MMNNMTKKLIIGLINTAQIALVNACCDGVSPCNQDNSLNDVYEKLSVVTGELINIKKLIEEK